MADFCGSPIPCHLPETDSNSLAFGLRRRVHFPHGFDDLLVVQDIEQPVDGDFTIPLAGLKGARQIIGSRIDLFNASPLLVRR